MAFLAWVAVGTGAAGSPFSPTLVLTALGLVGTLASVLGNEAAIRWGRRRLVAVVMGASVVIGAGIGFVGALSYPLAVALMAVYGFVVWMDSASLTAGTAGTAEPSRRGATLAVHSMLGYAGGFVGPLLVGFVLDLSGGMSRMGWGLGFLSIAVLVLLALAAFLVMRPGEVAGDRAG